MYYFIDSSGQQQGPVAAHDLPRYGVTPQTNVWKEGMANWQPAGSVAELSRLFASPPPVAPPLPYTPQPQPSVEPLEKPNNYLVWSVLATLLCCLPTGLVAIIQSNRVNTCWQAKDYAGAQKASGSAKTWCWVSVAIGIILIIIILTGEGDF